MTEAERQRAQDELELLQLQEEELVLQGDGKLDLSEGFGGSMEGMTARPNPVADTAKFVEGMGRSVIGGATFDFADEIESGVNAVVKSMFTDDTYMEAYGKRYGELEKDRQKFEKDNFKTALALNIAGGVMTGKVTPMNAMKVFGKLKNLSKGKAFVANTVNNAVEGVVAGVGSSEQGAETQGGATGAGLSTGMTIGGKSLATIGKGAINKFSKNRVGKEIIDELGNVTPLNIADKDGFLGNFYRSFVGQGLGSAEPLKKQTLEAIDRATPALQKTLDDLEAKTVNFNKGQKGVYKQAKNEITDRHKNLARAIAGQNKDEIATAKQGLAQAKAAAEKSVSEIQDTITGDLRFNTVIDAIPPSASEKEIAKITAIAKTDPRAASVMIDDISTKKAFKSVKDQSFDVDTAEIQDEIKKLLNTAGIGDSEDAILKTIAAKLTAKTKDGVISGEDLMEVRNTFARAVKANAKGNQALDNAALRRAKGVIDDTIKDGLDINAGRGTAGAKAMDFFDSEVVGYNRKLKLNDSIEGAKIEGEFTPDNILKAEGKGNVRRQLGKTLDAEQANRALGEAEIVGQSQILDAQNVADTAIEGSKMTKRLAMDEALATKRRESDMLGLEAPVDAKAGDIYPAYNKALDEAADLKRSLPTETSIFPKLASNELMARGAMSLMPSGVGRIGGVAAKLPVGMGVGRLMVKPKAQQLFAGQTKTQKNIADALRRYKEGGEEYVDFAANSARRGILTTMEEEDKNKGYY
jgi:hypothetical protein